MSFNYVGWIKYNDEVIQMQALTKTNIPKKGGNING